MKTILLSLLAAASLTAGAEELKQTLYFDFGSITAAQGTVTETDGNGNRWNNITNNTSGNKYAASGTVYDNLVNSANEPTGYVITLNSRFSTNGKSGGGGLLEPDAAKLGDLAVATATEDYFFIEKSENNSNFTISGLNPANGYRFSVFASRKAGDTRTGIYKMEGINLFSGELTLAGTNIGGEGINQNVSNILISEPVYPDDNGQIIFTVSRKQGDYIALNAMKIEELTGGQRPDATPVFTGATITGTATESGSPLPMHEVTADGKHYGIFEAYTLLRPGSFTIEALTDNGTTISFGTDAEGQLTAGAGEAAVESEQLSYLRANLATGELTVVPVTSWGLTGSVVPGGWTLTDNALLDYQGNGVWSATLSLSRESTISDPERFVFVMNKSWNYQMKRIAGTEASVGMASDGYSLEDIRLKHGTYTITLDLRDFVYRIESPAGIDPCRISVMGSSVANGEGADDNRGYAWMYGQLLGQRHDNGESEHPFYTSGISINGNNTVNLLNRYSELTHEFGRYVIFGVSLGNEGIHGAQDQEKVFNQFRDNMQTLISRAREQEKIPVVMNNYTRGDFNADDYAWVRRMNLLIHEWDVPSINLLGAIDNGSGNWADGYQHGDDIYHPSTDGHREFFYAMPPSLFDALHAGKPLPVRTTGNNFTVNHDGKIEFAPENVAHSFTLALGLTTLPRGQFATIATADGDITLTLSGETLTCTFPDGATISGQTAAEPTILTLTHYHAQGRTLLYARNTLLGETSGKLQPAKVTLSPAAGTLDLAEVFFYRSALNAEEVQALNAGRMLRSSLEIYLPFDNQDAPETNRAQSMNTPIADPGTPAAISDVSMDCQLPSAVSVYNIQGQLLHASLPAEALAALPSGLYLLVSPFLQGVRKLRIP